MPLGIRERSGTGSRVKRVGSPQSDRSTRPARPIARPGARRSARRPRSGLPQPLGLIRRVASLWFLSKILSLAIAGTAIWTVDYLVNSPSFEARSVLASGNELVPAEEIVEALQIGHPNVFHLRTNQLALRVERLPAIQSATIRPSLSGNIHVHVVERRPVMVWESAGHEVLADADGVAIRSGGAELPVIHGNLGGAIPIGGRVDLSAVRIVQALAPRLEELGLDTARIEWDAGQGVSLVADRGRLILGSADQIEAKLDAYRAIRQRLDQARTEAQVIDVRSLDRPYFR